MKKTTEKQTAAKTPKKGKAAVSASEPVETQEEYRQRIADAICEEIANSDLSLWDICDATQEYPSSRTFARWIADDEILRQKYACAKESQADYMAAQIRSIADECRVGEKTERKEVGRICSGCGVEVKWQGAWKHADESSICDGGEAQPVYETKTVSGDMVERSRLQIDARKWLASKLAPKKYGDKLELAGDPLSPLVINVVKFSDSK